MHSACHYRAGTMLLAILSILLSFGGIAGSSSARAEEDEWLKNAFAKRGTAAAMKVGVAEPNRKKRRAKRGVEVASLGGYTPSPSVPSIGRSLSGGGGVRWVASASCLNSALQGVVASLSSYGSVTVSSTCRSHSHNRRVGGARKSHHLTGSAVDFRLRGNVGGAMAYLRSSGVVGGLKHYGGGLFHIDTGPRRSW